MNYMNGNITSVHYRIVTFIEVGSIVALSISLVTVLLWVFLVSPKWIKTPPMRMQEPYLQVVTPNERNEQTPAWLQIVEV
jgi:hypothetical protein